MAKAIKIYKDGESKWTEADRLQRFLNNGWSVESGVSQQVTETVEHTVEEEEWDINSGEDWADSIESISVDDTTPDEEE